MISTATEQNRKTIRAWRELRKMTQQELAEKSTISVRTIQRLEKDDSAGSKYVLKCVCNALEIEVSDLVRINKLAIETETAFTEKESSPESEQDSNALRLLNLSPLFVLSIPIIGLLVSGLMFWYLRGKLMLQKKEALTICSFQVFWTIGTMAALVIVPALVESFAGMREYGRLPLNVWILFFSMLLNITVVLHTSIRLQNKKSILDFMPGHL